MHNAKWYKKLSNKEILCELCPRYCLIKNGSVGFCKVRENREGELYSLSYGYPVAMQLDPIEKKPLAEFMPGTKVFSLGTFGCNLECSFCQNHTLSRGDYKDYSPPYISPEELIKRTKQSGANSIAFTYNEPTVYAEYIIDTAILAKEQHIPVVLVSNGYISQIASDELYPLIDAANIDMKGFSETFYDEMTNGKLQPVCDSIQKLFNLEKHIELTNLIIPTKNDSLNMIAPFFDWVETALDRDVPLHFSAFFPTHCCLNLPRTSTQLLYDIKAYGNDRGFNHIYLGNI
jgi:pyruvate formate lyase activating enzyme